MDNLFFPLSQEQQTRTVDNSQPIIRGKSENNGPCFSHHRAQQAAGFQGSHSFFSESS
jgi:hypothetical protein